MWPEYLEDSVPAVVNIGPASPTGIVFGYGTKFPAKYQRALYACDWTFATIHAIHLRPHGASYRAEVEEFVGGTGLPVTDIVVGKDGAVYFQDQVTTHYQPWQAICEYGPDSKDPKKLANENNMCHNPSL